jgi:hypothetical protein
LDEFDVRKQRLLVRKQQPSPAAPVNAEALSAS